MQHDGEHHGEGLDGRFRPIEKLTQAAVEAAPGKGANYAYLHLPGEATVGALNVNAFNDPELIYYKCASLPAPK